MREYDLFPNYSLRGKATLEAGKKKAIQCPAFRNNFYRREYGGYRFVCLLKRNTETVDGFFKRCSRCIIPEDEIILKASTYLLTKKK